MLIIVGDKSLIASNARESTKWKEIEPGIFVGDYEDIDELGGKE